MRAIRIILATFVALVMSTSLANGATASDTQPDADESARSASGDLVLGDPGDITLAPDPDEELVQPASATGSAAIGAFTYSVRGLTLSIPAGCFLTHVLRGSGTRVTRDFAGVDCFGVAAIKTNNFCNYQFRFKYRNQLGNVYRTRSSPIYSKCKSQIRVYDAPAPFTARKGTACVEFWVNAKKRATQCHSITA